MAAPTAVSAFVGLAALLLAFVPLLRSPSRIGTTEGKCLNRPFEDLYTCHSSPFDYTPGHSPGTWGPWHWGPVCFRPEKASTSYCLVSSASYNSNRGVSIVARQDFIPQLGLAISDAGAASAASPYLSPAPNTAYRHMEIPGKGVGVIAHQEIKRGVPFMASLPGIIFDNEFRNLLETDTNAEELYRLAVDQLADRERVMGLARSAGGHELEDVLRTNAHTAKVSGTNLDLVYPEVAVSFEQSQRGAADFLMFL